MLNADDPNWIKEFTEFGLRDAWRNRGYFKVYVTAQARSLGGNSTGERFLVTAHVEEGLQYHLRDIRFRGVMDSQFLTESPFPEAELRAAIPMRDGEIFSVALIRKGIEALTKLYASHGYIDFATVPDTEVHDDPRPWISLVFTLDPAQQFRVGHLEIMMSDLNLMARIRELVRPGDIYNPDVIKNFLTENKSVMPPGVSSRDVSVDRYPKAGTVDLAFDFRTCP